jgi:hypothetical protein
MTEAREAQQISTQEPEFCDRNCMAVMEAMTTRLL